jgi:uncharacterized membrane protein YbhN (UPF0104 family)
MRMSYTPPTPAPTRPDAEEATRLALEDAVKAAPSEPAAGVSRRRLLVSLAFVVAALAGFYFLLPKVAGLHQTWGQLRHGDPLWLALAAALEIASIAGYVALFGTVFGRGMTRIDWRASIEIPLAGIAAIRLLAAAGAGGVAVTIWALRRAGMSTRVIACRMVTAYIVQYAVYLGAIIVCGVGLRLGVFAGEAPAALTIVPAALAGVIVAGVASMGLLPEDFERQMGRLARRSGMLGRVARRLLAAPLMLRAGVRTAVGLIADGRIGLLGALAYWGFDIAVLGCSFRAFGSVVPVAVLVMGYFLGTLGSLLPLPGGIGGVEGGMIGAFAAFGVPASRALVAVLAYRAISFWLPTLPGIAGYVALRSKVRGWRRDDAALESRE